MHKFLKRFLASALLACFPLVFSACGGGGNDVEMTTVSGIAMKGPIKGALVQVFKLRSDGTTGELLGSGTSDGSAAYSVPIPKAKAVPPLLVKVSGQAGALRTSETTGADIAFTPSESFNAVLDTFDTSKKYTVSPLTDAAYQQVQKFLTDNPASVADERIISAANARVASLFGVSDILAAPSDPINGSAYTASLIVIDQMVVDTGTANTLQAMSLINQAFTNVESPSYQTYQAAVTSAATAVVAQNLTNPTLVANVNDVVSVVAAPPAEPTWTDTTAPNAVTNFTAVAGAETATTGSVTLAWKASTTVGSNKVTGYDVYRNGTKIASVTSASYVDKALAPSTAYKYSIITFDAAGNRSASSVELTATTPAALNLNITVSGQLASNLMSLPFKDINAPAAPANLAASTSAINATTSSVKLTWSASTDNVAVNGYDVYRGATKMGTVSTTIFTDPSVTSGVASSYTVIAFDAAGNRSVASGALSVTPIAPNLGINVGGVVN